MKAARSGYSVEASLRERIDQLERQLHAAKAELALTIQERDMALLELEHMEHRLLIARGEGGK
jgi:regulator of replication initiation timing